MIIIPDPVVIEEERQTGIGARFDFGTTASASAIETLIRSPVSSLVRAGNFDIAILQDRSKPKMTPEEFKKSEFFRPGLSFPNGVGVNVARLVAERKDAENLRNFTIRKGSARLSAFGQVGLFGTSLMAAMLDPLNVSTAFIPIVGQARFASMVSKVGFTGARAGRGVVEGAIGAALVEPIVLFAAIQEQADYDSMDSLLNITFGAAFGAGLHVTFGKIGDIIRGDTPQIRELKLRAAVAQALDGRKVDIDPITKVSEDAEIDPNTGLEIPSRVQALEPIQQILQREGTSLDNQSVILRMEEILNTPEEKLTAIEKEFLREVNKNPELEKLAEILLKSHEERTFDDLMFLRSFKDKSTKVNVDAENAKIEELEKKIAQAKQGKPRTDKGRAAKQRKISKLEKEKKEIEAQKEAKEPEQAKSTFTEEEIRSDVESTFKPEADSTYNKSDIDFIDEAVDKAKREDLKQELSDSEAKIKNLKEQGILKDQDLEEYNESIKLLNDVNKMEGVIDAIAVCVAR